jgi:hypothetical protein
LNTLNRHYLSPEEGAERWHLKRRRKSDCADGREKMWRSNYAPPLLRLFWKAGGKMPPPPFAPFWRNMLFFAAWFGPLWGVFMWFSTWQSEGYSASGALFASVTAGAYSAF